jgi:drug/metabolite transporter (DMT)-like permease
VRSKSFTSGLSSLLCASLLWAFSFGLIETHLAGLDPYAVACIRLALSFLLFLPLLRVRGVAWPLLLQLLGIGAAQYGVMYVAYIKSYQYLSGHEVALFTIFTPLYVAAWHAVGRHKLPRRFLLAAVLAVLGAAVIQFHRPGASMAWRGILLLQVANLAFAFGQVAYRHVMPPGPGRLRDRDVFAVLYAGGMLLSSAACLADGGWTRVHLSHAQMWVLLYLGLVPSGIGFFLWNRGARRVNHGSLAVMNNIKIPIAVFVTIVLFHEPANLARLLTGGAVMLLAVWLCERKG